MTESLSRIVNLIVSLDPIRDCEVVPEVNKRRETTYNRH